MMMTSECAKGTEKVKSDSWLEKSPTSYRAIRPLWARNPQKVKKKSLPEPSALGAKKVQKECEKSQKRAKMTLF